MELDFQSSIPLHYQVSQRLADEIVQEKYFEKIPSERELMERFAVSRSTIREAINRLVQQGTLTKIHGKGTFISKGPPLHDWLPTLNSFTDVVKQMGMRPSAMLLHHGELTAASKIVSVLGMKRVYTIERLRFANDLPVAIEQHYYGLDVGHQLAQHDLNTAVIYELLEQTLHIPLREAEQTISSRVATATEAAHLTIPPQTCMLTVERILRDDTNRVVEYYKGIYRPDLYQFRIRTKRKK